jgi:hypothetical protein
MELSEFLQFPDDWLTAGHETADTLLARFTGYEAYGVQSLRGDLARFMFLLGASAEQDSSHTPASQAPLASRTCRHRCSRKRIPLTT